MSGIWNIKKNPIEQGATFERTITVEDVDITGWGISMCIKPDTGTSSPITLNSGNGGITITDAPNGEFKVLLTDEQTSLIGWTSGRHEIFADLPDDSRKKLLTGEVKVTLKVC